MNNFNPSGFQPPQDPSVPSNPPNPPYQPPPVSNPQPQQGYAQPQQNPQATNPAATHVTVNQTVIQDQSHQGPRGPRSNGLSTAGFIISLFSGILFLIPILNMVLPALAVILSILGLKKADQNDHPKGLAIAGLVIGGLVLISALIYSIVVLATLSGANEVIKESQESFLFYL